VEWEFDEDSYGVGYEHHKDLEGARQKENLEGSGQEHHSSFMDDRGWRVCYRLCISTLPVQEEPHGHPSYSASG
jgi:hypothetical protein